MSKTHLTVEDVVNEYGCKFNEIKDGSVDNIFLRWLDRSPLTTDTSAVLASINPVTPHHTFMIPLPEVMGAFQDAAGTWHGLPEDSYTTDVPLMHRHRFAADFMDWVSLRQRVISEMPGDIKIARSFSTTNEGPESSRAVKWAHNHDLILLEDEDYAHPHIQALGNVDNFCRLPEQTPLKILRKKDKEHLHDIGMAGALGKWKKDFLTLAYAFAKQAQRSLPNVTVKPVISIDPDREVRPGHSAIFTDVYIDQNKDVPAAALTTALANSMIQIDHAASAFKLEFRNAGANGFTTLMETTYMRDFEVARSAVDTKNCLRISQHIIPHPEGVPFTKGGFVYALQKATAPAFQ